VRHHYSNKEKQFIIENAKGISCKELTKKFNRKFRLKVSENSIKIQKSRLGVKSGIITRFEKGQIPFNKGLEGYMKPEQYEKCKKTMIKKGHVPHNIKPVGSERKNKKCGMLIKSKEGYWTTKARYIYEQEYGKIPDGYKVIFADRNINNFNLDNLVLVSNAEAMIMSNKQLFKENKELTKTGVIIAKVIHKANGGIKYGKQSNS
jgi:hypothetical protein